MQILREQIKLLESMVNLELEDWNLLKFKSIWPLGLVLKESSQGIKLLIFLRTFNNLMKVKISLKPLLTG
jgi:hypothetical protein